jgi:hypothetical protein
MDEMGCSLLLALDGDLAEDKLMASSIIESLNILNRITRKMQA